MDIYSIIAYEHSYFCTTVCWKVRAKEVLAFFRYFDQSQNSTLTCAQIYMCNVGLKFRSKFQSHQFSSRLLYESLSQTKSSQLQKHFILRTKVRGDFKIHGTRYFQGAVFQAFSVITSRVNISWRVWVFWPTKGTVGLQHHNLLDS